MSQPDTKQFSESVYDDILTDVQGDPEKAVKYWTAIKIAVDRLLGIRK